MPNLQDLPLPLAVIIAAFWIINQNNAEFAKKLAALISEFTSKYEALVKTVAEERKAAADRWLERDRLLSEDRKEDANRWLERDRLLNERLEKNTIAQEKIAYETHQLRNMVTPLVVTTEAERKRSRGAQSPRNPGGGNHDAAD